MKKMKPDHNLGFAEPMFPAKMKAKKGKKRKTGFKPAY